MPCTRQEDVNWEIAVAASVVVERRPEASLVACRDKRIDENDSLARLGIDAANVTRPRFAGLPRGMRNRPLPQPRPDLSDFHDAMMA